MFRHKFDRTILAFLILALAFIVGIWGVTHRIENQIRKDINNYNEQVCLTRAIPIRKNYNNVVNILIKIREAELENFLENGQLDRAELSQDAINTLKKNRINVPTLDECLSDSIRR